MHVLLHDDQSSGSAPSIRVGGPRFGLIVSKAVGPAVVRHRVARRLRHICANIAAELPASTDIVLRALPGAADASSADLERQVRGGLRKLGTLAEPETAAVDNRSSGESGVGAEPVERPAGTES